MKSQKILSSLSTLMKTEHKKYIENGRKCLSCGKKQGEETPEALNPYHCKDCNDRTRKVIDDLSNDQGASALDRCK